MSELSLERTNTENLKQIFPEKELARLESNFHINVSVSVLYIPAMNVPILLLEVCGPNLANT
jgi:hypothetical protein